MFEGGAVPKYSARKSAACIESVVVVDFSWIDLLVLRHAADKRIRIKSFIISIHHVSLDPVYRESS